MSTWADDVKGNELHEGDFVEFALRLYARQEARETLNGRRAYIKKLKPGMPCKAILERCDPVTREYLKQNKTTEIPCDHLRLID